MGLFNNQFPYSNFHELNLDWVISELKALDEKVNSIKDTISGEIKAYVDERFAELLNGRIAEVERDVRQLERDFAATTAELDARHEQFVNYVNAQIQLIRTDVADARAAFDAMIMGANAYTDVKIEQAEERILRNLGEELAQVRILNFFTGDYVTVQEMFDTLAQLHVSDGLTYNEIAQRAKTYTQIEGYRRSYTDITLYSNTIIV
ncbi:MAG: hypothetical protein KBT02_10245 [Treponema sp.]|nr:hypothetical protein [Candidatus Treponema caballi]